MFGENINEIFQAISTNLKYPVLIFLLLLVVLTLIQVGYLVVEFFTEHRHLKAKMPVMMEALRESGVDMEACIQEGGLLKSQKKALIELCHHPKFSDVMREALAVKLLEKEQARFDRRVIYTDTISKLGPMFGLLGTLIPLGPGILALSQGDVVILSQSLLTAFDTTIVGLIVAAVATLISTVRKSWYAYYMSVLETLAECVLEVVKGNAEQE